jgi:hypothetical protein
MSNACPACGKKYSLPTGAVGRAFVCKRCGLKLQISEHGLAIPSVPDNGPPIPPPQVVGGDDARRFPPQPAIPVAAAPPASAYPPPGYYNYPAAPVAAPAVAAPVAAPRPASPPQADEFEVFSDDVEEPPRPRPRPQKGSPLLDFLLLRRHIAPSLIVVVFWCGTVLLVLSGLRTLVGSFDAAPSPTGLAGFDLGGLNLGDANLAPGGEKLPVAKERSSSFSFGWFVFGLTQLFIGPLVLRVVCEFLFVVFRINETLLDVKERLRPT